MQACHSCTLSAKQSNFRKKFAKWDPCLIEMLLLLQMHLEDAKFEELFEMSKKEWESVPQWKKNQKKKTLELF